MNQIEKTISDVWGTKSVNEIATITGIKPLQVLEIVLKFDLKQQKNEFKSKHWESFEIDFLKIHSDELTTGKAANILSRSRYAIYMKAKQIGLNNMILKR